MNATRGNEALPKNPPPLRRWLISDLHLGHRLVVESGERPADFATILAKNWHRLVGPEDRVYVLGDVILGQASQLAQYMEALPGRKVLIRGNHDMEPSRWYWRRGFDFVHDAVLEKDVLLTHVPQVPLPDFVRLNVHGHLHGPGTGHHDYRRSQAEPYYSENEHRYRLVYLEGIYAPIPWEDVCG